MSRLPCQRGFARRATRQTFCPRVDRLLGVPSTEETLTPTGQCRKLYTLYLVTKLLLAFPEARWRNAQQSRQGFIWEHWFFARLFSYRAPGPRLPRSRNRQDGSFS